MKTLLRVVRDRVQQIYWLLKPPEYPNETRYEYQQKYIRHQFKEGESVLDIGSGGDPFPFATVLVDKYLEPTNHRTAPFRDEGKPVYVCDVCKMPFEDKSFDYVVASHVLEHVDNPILACKEIMRVGKAGYIESPSLMKDTLFSWAKGMHKWHILAQGNTLFFFEYTDRQVEGIRTDAFEQLLFSTVYHPLQKAFNKNQNVFNVMLEWVDKFEVIVVKKNGEIIR